LLQDGAGFFLLFYQKNVICRQCRFEKSTAKSDRYVLELQIEGIRTEISMANF